MVSFRFDIQRQDATTPHSSMHSVVSSDMAPHVVWLLSPALPATPLPLQARPTKAAVVFSIISFGGRPAKCNFRISMFETEARARVSSKASPFNAAPRHRTARRPPPPPDEGGEHFPAISLGGRPAKCDFEISTCKTEAGSMFFKPGAPSTASPSHRTARRTTVLTDP